MLRRSLLKLVAALLLMGAMFAHAQVGELAVGGEQRYALSRAFLVLEDGSGQLTLQDAERAFSEGKFRPVAQSSSATNFGLTSSAFWLRVVLKAQGNAPANWLLDLALPPLDRVDFYASRADGGFDHLLGGDLQPFASRAVPHRNHVMPLLLKGGEARTVYLRIESKGTVSAPTDLWQPAALWQHDQREYSALSLYFGLMIGLFLYNLLLYFSLRDPAYLIYVMFVGCFTVSQAALNGMAAQFLWPEWTWWNNVSINAGNAASGALGILFARTFLATRSTMPRADAVMRWQAGLWLLSLGAALLLPYVVAVWMLTVLAPITVFTLVTVAVVSVHRGHPGARYFLMSWAVLLLGVIVLTLHNTGALPSNVLTANALPIGSSLEMLLLSFALADRINTERREKEQALAAGMAEHAMVEALNESQQRYRSLLEEREALLNNAVVGIVLSVKRRHEWINEKFAQMMGYRREELVGQSSAYIHPDMESWERFGAEARATLIATGTYVDERQLKRRNGELFWVQMGGSCIRPNDPDSGVIWTFLDITQRRQSEQDTREAVEQQKQLNELRSRFVAMTSHEFRTPLASILSSQELLRHYGERLPEDEKATILDEIAAAVQRMMRMLDRVLLIGKSEAQMLEFKPAMLALAPLCRALAEEAKAQWPQSTCEVVTHIADNVTTGLYDEKLLRHIFGNLLSNAIKYSPQGGQVGFDVINDAEDTVFRVSDHGIGIPPDEIPHLFESFHRASNVGDIPGTGLGLAIVRNAVKMHGGHIEVTSSPGNGTCFEVRLPRGPARS